MNDLSFGLTVFSIIGTGIYRVIIFWTCLFLYMSFFVHVLYMSFTESSKLDSNYELWLSDKEIHDYFLGCCSYFTARWLVNQLHRHSHSLATADAERSQPAFAVVAFECR